MQLSTLSERRKLFPKHGHSNKGKRCFARESLDVDIQTHPPVSQSFNPNDRIAAQMRNAIEIAKVAHRERRFSDSLWTQL